MQSTINHGKGHAVCDNGTCGVVLIDHTPCTIIACTVGDKKTFPLFTAVRFKYAPYRFRFTVDVFTDILLNSTQQEMLRSWCGISTEKVRSEII